MLNQIVSDDFEVLVDAPCALYLPDGQPLPVVIEKVTLRPKSQLPGSARIPFNVALRSLQNTAFVEGACAIDFASQGRLDGIYVSREPATGRDEQFGYFNIVFN